MFEITIDLYEVIIIIVSVIIYLALLIAYRWKIKKLNEYISKLGTLNEHLQEICNYDTMKLYETKIKILEDKIKYYQTGLARRSDIASQD